MKLLSVPLALFLLAAPYALAGEADCLAQPTRACVFQMALLQADGEDRPMFLALGYLAVAYLQEQEQTGDAAQTRAALLAKLLHDNPDPASARQALNTGAISLSFSDVPLGDQPETDMWLQSTLIELCKQAGLPVDDFSKWKSPTVKASIRAKIAATAADTLPKFARLDSKRGPEVTRLHITLPDVLDWAHARLLKGLFAKGALSGARTEISTWTDAQQKANGYAALALTYARAGETALALDLARSPELADLTLLNYDAKLSLVEVWAHAGALKANKILPPVSPLVEYPLEMQPNFRASITVAMVMGDITTAHDLLATIKPWERGIAIIPGIEAALDHDPARVGALIDLFPREEQAEFLYRLGEAQIRVGDAQGAFATIDQLANVPDPMLSARTLRGLLAPVLAAIGHEVEAVRLADEVGNAKVTALVAARLQ